MGIGILVWLNKPAAAGLIEIDYRDIGQMGINYVDTSNL